MTRLRDRDPAALSPYLRQHADNPVDWYEWGDDLFAAARALDRPILLSIGYSTCHWCHVMAHESFEDPDIAASMNRWFVNVKVDREERPDVDAIYMEAVQRLTGRGGWPLTAFLTPDGRPFYAGTYFPPEDRTGMPGFPRVLAAMADVWRDKRAEVDEQADVLRDAIAASNDALGASSDHPEGPSVAALDTAADAIVAQLDPAHGGFGGAPKFPQAMTIEYLWHTFVRTGDPRVRDAATRSLDHMAAGGIHDQLGGGFHRYSVDARWLVPHFEKMLYDQALLTRAYLAGYLATGADRWRRVVETTVEYVLRDLRHAQGGFFSAEDADSDGMEGRFYVWAVDELRDALGEDALEGSDTAALDEVLTWFGTAPAGNFVDPTGHAPPRTNVLHLPARATAPDEPEPPAATAARPALLAARDRRTRPGLDDKVVLAWNALFLRTLVDAAAALERDDWMDAARANARFLLATLRDDGGRLLRAWQPGAGARHRAYAEDHAALLGALLSLTEHDSLDWLADARAIADQLVLHYAAPDGGFFTTADDAEQLIVRTTDLLDNATPSANSLAADALARLAAITGDEAYARPARAIVERLAAAAERHPTAFANLLLAAERVVFPPIEVALVAPRSANPAGAHALRREVEGRLIPASVLVQATGADDRTPLLTARDAPGDEATAFVCEHYACQMPTTDPEALRTQLDAALAMR